MGTDMSNNPEAFIARLKGVMQQALALQDYEKAMAAASACGYMLYEWNQYYTDDELEQGLSAMAEELVRPAFSCGEARRGTVLFYDGFGLDVRGLALIYLDNLCRLGYEVIYALPLGRRGQQPTIARACQGGNLVTVYYDTRSGLGQLASLMRIFEKYKPGAAFFYTLPDDVAGAIAFEGYGGLVDRYLVNLTDHAFWLGRSACDYCLEFRNYGASISAHYRKLSKERLRILLCYPYVNDLPFAGLPPEAAGKQKIVFSGGSLYKTWGDGGHLYYKMMADILEQNLEAVFIYAGVGDNSGLKDLYRRFPGRVSQIAERADLFQLMQRVQLYVNTYPMAGGLMTQYAALAGLVPLTLKNPSGAFCEVLLDQEKSGIEFSEPEALIREAGRLLNDEAYRKQRGQDLKRLVITPEQFRAELQDLLLHQHTSFEVRAGEAVDTKDFRAGYVARFNLEKMRMVVAARENRASLKPDFPDEFRRCGK